VAAKPESTIRFAIRGCLVRCGQTEAPLTCLAEFTEELRKTGWDEASVHAVEWGVLSRLMGSSTASQPAAEQTQRRSQTGMTG
jgi:hypothetical protein